MVAKSVGEFTGREFFLQSLGLGTPGQNQGVQTANNTNAVNQAFQNNTQNTNNSLNFLQSWLAKNPAPVTGWGNIVPPQPAKPLTPAPPGGDPRRNALSGLVGAPAAPNGSNAPATPDPAAAGAATPPNPWAALLAGAGKAAPTGRAIAQ